MDKTTAYSNKQPIWQLVLLIFCTFGLYEIYWFYRNWKQLYPPNQKEVTPWLRTLGLFVPFVNIVLIWFQFIDIRDFSKQKGITSFNYPGWFSIIFVITHGIANYFWLPLLGFPLPALLLIIPQITINRYWEKETPTLPEKTKLPWPEIVICCIGGVLLIWMYFNLLMSLANHPDKEHYLHRAGPITSSEYYYHKPADT